MIQFDAERKAVRVFNVSGERVRGFGAVLTLVAFSQLHSQDRDRRRSLRSGAAALATEVALAFVPFGNVAGKVVGGWGGDLLTFAMQRSAEEVAAAIRQQPGPEEP